MTAQPTWVRMVRASGDTTGAEDLANIHAARDAFYASSLHPYAHGLIVLPNKSYYVNAPIVLGDKSAPSTNYMAPGLAGVGVAYITYTGAHALASYLITLAGNTGDAAVRLSNLYLNCAYKIRGLLSHTQTYFHSIQNIVVDSSMNVGVDVVDSWKGSIRNVHVRAGRGIGMRLRTANQMFIENIRIAYMADSYWPELNDTSVPTYQAGVYVQTPDVERAGLVLSKCSLNTLRDVMFEGNTLGARPLCSIDDECAQVFFEGSLYSEADDSSDAKILIVGGSDNTGNEMEYGFENVMVYQQTPAYNSLIKTTGYVTGVRVNGLVSTPCTVTNVVKAATGVLVDCECDRIRAVGPSGALPSANYIAAAEGASFVNARAIGADNSTYEEYT